MSTFTVPGHNKITPQKYNFAEQHMDIGINTIYIPVNCFLIKTTNISVLLLGLLIFQQAIPFLVYVNEYTEFKPLFNY